MTVLLEPFPPWLRDVNRFSSSETQVPRFVPPADVLVSDGGATVYMDVPGCPADALDIELENDVLTVRGERPYPYEESAGAVRRIERGFGHHRTAVAQREGEAPYLPFFTTHLERAEMTPVHLALFAGWRLEASHRNRARRLPLRPQPIRQNRIAAAVTALL